MERYMEGDRMVEHLRYPGKGLEMRRIFRKAEFGCVFGGSSGLLFCTELMLEASCPARSIPSSCGRAGPL